MLIHNTITINLTLVSEELIKSLGIPIFPPNFFSHIFTKGRIFLKIKEKEYKVKRLSVGWFGLDSETPLIPFHRKDTWS